MFFSVVNKRKKSKSTTWCQKNSALKSCKLNTQKRLMKL